MYTLKSKIEALREVIRITTTGALFRELARSLIHSFGVERAVFVLCIGGSLLRLPHRVVDHFDDLEKQCRVADDGDSALGGVVLAEFVLAALDQNLEEVVRQKVSADHVLHPLRSLDAHVHRDVLLRRLARGHLLQKHGPPFIVGSMHSSSSCSCCTQRFGPLAVTMALSEHDAGRSLGVVEVRSSGGRHGGGSGGAPRRRAGAAARRRRGRGDRSGSGAGRGVDAAGGLADGRGGGRLRVRVRGQVRNSGQRRLQSDERPREIAQRQSAREELLPLGAPRLDFLGRAVVSAAAAAAAATVRHVHVHVARLADPARSLQHWSRHRAVMTFPFLSSCPRSDQRLNLASYGFLLQLTTSTPARERLRRRASHTTAGEILHLASQ
ncbi:hypothetical protein Mapa_017035 [Marchantia paleacea]|nr:hypothetical protein Mapa_017035 [Marchantia paleacea]